MLLLPAVCATTERTAARARVRQAYAVLAFVGLSRAVAQQRREPEIVYVPSPDAQAAYAIVDRLDSLMAFLDYVLTPNREMVAV